MEIKTCSTDWVNNISRWKKGDFSTFQEQNINLAKKWRKECVGFEDEIEKALYSAATQAETANETVTGRLHRDSSHIYTIRTSSKNRILLLRVGKTFYVQWFFSEHEDDYEKIKKKIIAHYSEKKPNPPSATFLIDRTTDIELPSIGISSTVTVPSPSVVKVETKAPYSDYYSRRPTEYKKPEEDDFI